MNKFVADFHKSLARNLKDILRIAFLLPALSYCAQHDSRYILSHNTQIQILEKSDHDFCSSLKIDFDTESFTSKSYWECRLYLAKFKASNPNYGGEIQATQIDDLVRKITLKIYDAGELNIVKEINKIDDRQHKECDTIFSQHTEDRNKVEDYFLCRSAKINEFEIPPFNNSEYLSHKIHSYNLGFAINRRIDSNIKTYNDAKINYPTCVKFNIKSPEFSKCVAKQKQSEKCLSEIPEKQFRREIEEKLACQRQGYLKFPDRFIRKDEELARQLQKAIDTSNYYNQQSFASLGIDDKKFSANPVKIEEEKSKHLKKINSKDQLYTRSDLIKIRSIYITSCQKEINKKMVLFVNELVNSCSANVEDGKIIDLN